MIVNQINPEQLMVSTISTSPNGNHLLLHPLLTPNIDNNNNNNNNKEGEEYQDSEISQFMNNWNGQSILAPFPLRLHAPFIDLTSPIQSAHTSSPFNMNTMQSVITSTPININRMHHGISQRIHSSNFDKTKGNFINHLNEEYESQLQQLRQRRCKRERTSITNRIYHINPDLSSKERYEKKQEILGIILNIFGWKQLMKHYKHILMVIYWNYVKEDILYLVHIKYMVH